MKRLKTTASCVTIAALAAVGTGLAPANAATKSHTLHLTSRTLVAQQKANKLSETDRVLVAGKTVGFSVSHCVFNFAIGQAACDGAVALPSGLLYVKVKVNGQTGASTGVVTGGTGAYAHAKGTTTGKPGSRPSDTVITVIYHT